MYAAHQTGYSDELHSSRFEIVAEHVERSVRATAEGLDVICLM